MNQTDLILTLIQFVALTLPAVGIYMQILQKSHTRVRGNGSETDMSGRYVDYHLARGGLLMFVVSGFILIIQLMLLQPPTLIGGQIGRWLIIFFTYGSLCAIGIAMTFIGMSVFVRGKKLDGRKSIFDAILESIYYSNTILSHLWYRMKNYIN